MFGGLSPFHWLIVLLVVVIIFGPKRLPEIGKAVGEGIKALKQASENKDEEKQLEKVEVKQ